MQSYIQIISKEIFFPMSYSLNVYLETPECIPSWFTTKMEHQKENFIKFVSSSS